MRLPSVPRQYENLFQQCSFLLDLEWYALYLVPKKVGLPIYLYSVCDWINCVEGLSLLIAKYETSMHGQGGGAALRTCNFLLECENIRSLDSLLMKGVFRAVPEPNLPIHFPVKTREPYTYPESIV